jgi:hypothetical protein
MSFVLDAVTTPSEASASCQIGAGEHAALAGLQNALAHRGFPWVEHCSRQRSAEDVCFEPPVLRLRGPRRSKAGERH